MEHCRGGVWKSGLWIERFSSVVICVVCKNALRASRSSNSHFGACGANASFSTAFPDAFFEHGFAAALLTPQFSVLLPNSASTEETISKSKAPMFLTNVVEQDRHFLRTRACRSAPEGLVSSELAFANKWEAIGATPYLDCCLLEAGFGSPEASAVFCGIISSALLCFPVGGLPGLRKTHYLKINASRLKCCSDEYGTNAVPIPLEVWRRRQCGMAFWWVALHPFVAGHAEASRVLAATGADVLHYLVDSAQPTCFMTFVDV